MEKLIKSIFIFIVFCNWFYTVVADYDIAFRWWPCAWVWITTRDNVASQVCITWSDKNSDYWWPAFDPTWRLVLWNWKNIYNRDLNTSSEFLQNWWYSAKYSPDWLKILYEWFDWKVYLKNSNDNWTWSVVLNEACSYWGINISPDWWSFLYSNWCDWNKLYLKTTTPWFEWQWVAMTSNVSYQSAFSNDGSYIIYSNYSDGRKIYKKSRWDTENWTAISSYGSYFLTYSPDDTEIIYQYSWTEKLWIKNANDTWNWVEFTSDVRALPEVIPTYIEPSCVDWLQNQDETWIDEGGVCAIVLPTTVPPVSVWWCEEKTFFEWDPNAYNIWNWTYSDQSGTWWTYTNFQWNWLNDGNSYMDRFSVYPFYEWSLINSDTFTWWIDADINTTFVNWWLKTSLSVSLSRTWSVAYINYVKVKTNESWQSIPYSDYDNVIANVDFIWQDWSKNSFPLIYSWWYATAFSNVLAKNIKITWLQNLTISWFEVWKSNATPIIKYNCKDFVYNCWWIEQGPGNFDCKLLWSLQGFDFHCVINWNACEPLPWIWWSWGTIIPPTPNIDLLYDYWSWFSLSWSVRSINLKTEDIFACIDKETGEELTGLSVFWCPFIIVSNIWGKFTNYSNTIINLLLNISNIWSPSWTWWQIFWFLFNTAFAESIDLKIPFNYTATGQLKQDVSYTWTELGWFNKSFYDSMDNTKNLQDWWIKSIYSYAIWFLILISLVTVLSLFFWGLSN